MDMYYCGPNNFYAWKDYISFDWYGVALPIKPDLIREILPYDDDKSPIVLCGFSVSDNKLYRIYMSREVYDEFVKKTKNKEGYNIKEVHVLQWSFVNPTHQCYVDICMNNFPNHWPGGKIYKNAKRCPYKNETNRNSIRSYGVDYLAKMQAQKIMGIF